MEITPNPLTISQLFSGNNEQFYIPAYQRRFSWQEKQLIDLFEDIDLLKQSDTHLLGTILCLTGSHTAGLNILELVDGQQRITSISILLKVIQDRFEELEENEIKDEINSYMYCKSIDRKLQNKVLLGDLDNPDYVKLLIKKNMHSIKNNNLKEAYELFYRLLEDYDKNKLNSFYFKFINKVKIIRLDVGQAKDAYKLFETINNRGLSLSPTDIIKNFLLGHASSIDNRTLDIIRKDWKDVIVNLDGIDTDDFFRQYMSSILQRKITKSKLVDEFKKHYIIYIYEAKNLPEYKKYKEIRIQKLKNIEKIKNELDGNEYEDDEIETDEIQVEENNTSMDFMEIDKFTSNLRNSSNIYNKILLRKFSDEKINRKIYNLQRIRSFPAYIFLLDLFKRELSKSKYYLILHMIEVFMLRRHICEYRTGELDDIFSSLVKIPNKNIVEDVHDKLKKHLPTDVEFETKFKTHSYKSNGPRAKYVLEVFEYETIRDQG
ncbi:MAG: DUF262 domain-containing protein [Candidatus Cloacimonadota bacterium]|nr:DUF262 domain-containing protein [Candidatus Cloacimonadota bacterium]